MPFPKLENGRVDTQVTTILLAEKNENYIVDKILPVVPNLTQETGLIASIGDSHLRIYNSKRSMWDENDHRIHYEISNDDTYRIDFYDQEIYIPDRLANQLQSPFDSRRDASTTVIEAMKLEREAALAALMTSTAILTNNTTLTGTSQYDDYVNSTPETDFETARTSVFNATGKEANVIAMNRAVFNTLKLHPFFLNNIKGVKMLKASQLVDVLKDIFEVDEVLVGKTRKVTSKEGQATVTKSVVWGNDVVFFYRPRKPSLWTPSFGYSFQLKGKNLRASMRRAQSDLGNLHRVEWAYQDKILDVGAAYLIKDAI